MKRTLLMLIAMLALGALPLFGQDGSSSDSSLDDELAAFLAELETPQYTDDPFAEGRVPDLVILSSTDVQGEVAPCG